MKIILNLIANKACTNNEYSRNVKDMIPCNVDMGSVLNNYYDIEYLKSIINLKTF